mmetsp:Transcript_16742/g.29315  ORF Transcript_16742/g.29315 Transcript_16742/m.29315 type:complete len:213 (+) Transcript_16742:1089-1727(+)
MILMILCRLEFSFCLKNLFTGRLDMHLLVRKLFCSLSIFLHACGLFFERVDDILFDSNLLLLKHSLLLHSLSCSFVHSRVITFCSLAHALVQLAGSIVTRHVAEHECLEGLISRKLPLSMSICKLRTDLSCHLCQFGTVNHSKVNSNLQGSSFSTDASQLGPRDCRQRIEAKCQLGKLKLLLLHCLVCLCIAVLTDCLGLSRDTFVHCTSCL